MEGLRGFLWAMLGTLLQGHFTHTYGVPLLLEMNLHHAHSNATVIQPTLGSLCHCTPIVHLI